MALVFMICPPHDFYPRSPCGERRVTVLGIQHKVGISIHALLAESDAVVSCTSCLPLVFLSTLSLRRATILPFVKTPPTQDFYPRSPCGERLRFNRIKDQGSTLFLSTLSLRRATPVIHCLYTAIFVFLSTLSLRRATIFSLHLVLILQFLSTLSLRRATSLDTGQMNGWRAFLSTLSLRRAT